VDVYILRLRQKIERDASAPGLIHSVRGFGYSFEPRNRMDASQPDADLKADLKAALEAAS
jgi:hypothetical protein